MQIFKTYSILLSLILAVLLQSCDSPSLRGSSRTGQSVAGKVGELLVVCENSIWNSDIKSGLDSNLTQFILPYFPDVPTFMLTHKTPKHFEKGVKRYRQILFIDIDPSFSGEKASIEQRKNVWAVDQLVIDITAKNMQQLSLAFQNGLGKVHDAFEEMEWKRMMRNFARTPNRSIEKELKKSFGISLALPDGARLLNKKPNFFRIDFPIAYKPLEFSNAGAQDRGTVFSGIMVYQYDYINSSQLSLSNLLKARDTVLKYNAPYEVDGMYMGTQYAPLVYPELDSMQNAANTIKNGVEMRGMFQYIGRPVHSTGGCFWAYHFVHPKRKKVVCVSGFLDAPSTASWIHQLRELQAVLKSTELAG